MIIIFLALAMISIAFIFYVAFTDNYEINYDKWCHTYQKELNKTKTIIKKNEKIIKNLEFKISKIK